jgi:hypothetical protein
VDFEADGGDVARPLSGKKDEGGRMKDEWRSVITGVEADDGTSEESSTLNNGQWRAVDGLRRRNPAIL